MLQSGKYESLKKTDMKHTQKTKMKHKKPAMQQPVAII